jgi:hypothetical protein
VDGSQQREEWIPADTPPLPDVLVRVKFRGRSGWAYEPAALYRREVDGTWWLRCITASKRKSWRRCIGEPTHWRLP